MIGVGSSAGKGSLIIGSSSAICGGAIISSVGGVKIGSAGPGSNIINSEEFFGMVSSNLKLTSDGLYTFTFSTTGVGNESVIFCICFSNSIILNSSGIDSIFTFLLFKNEELYSIQLYKESSTPFSISEKLYLSQSSNLISDGVPKFDSVIL